MERKETPGTNEKRGPKTIGDCPFTRPREKCESTGCQLWTVERPDDPGDCAFSKFITAVNRMGSIFFEFLQIAKQNQAAMQAAVHEAKGGKKQ